MKFELFSELVEKNGNTVKQNNLAIPHKYPVGTLVEYKTKENETNWEGIRLYVTAHTRDCDGTPLYDLGSKDGYTSEHGFDQDSLKAVDWLQKMSEEALILQKDKEDV